MSFPKRLVQVITLSVFFFLLAGFVAYRSGEISTIFQSDSSAVILEKAIASPGYVELSEAEKDSLKQAYYVASPTDNDLWMSLPEEVKMDIMSSSKSGPIVEGPVFKPFPEISLTTFQDTTKKKKKTKNLGMTVNPTVMTMDSTEYRMHVMTKEDSAARKQALIMSSSKSMIVKPPKAKSKKKKKD